VSSDDNAFNDLGRVGIYLNWMNDNSPDGTFGFDVITNVWIDGFFVTQ